MNEPVKLPSQNPSARTRDVTYPGKGREGADLTIRLHDDGYRIYAEYVAGGPVSIGPGEFILWAEYKHCDLPSIGTALADLLMTGEPDSIP